MKKVTVPHPELIEPFYLSIEKVGEVLSSIGGKSINYRVYEWNSNLEDPIGVYDEDAQIYISKKLRDESPTYADLIAYHEQVEIDLKMSGVEHWDAHVLAYVAELKVAHNMLCDAELRKYIKWRLSLYSDSRLPAKEEIASAIFNELRNMASEKKLSEIVLSLGL
jgi:hypothetical protein